MKSWLAALIALSLLTACPSEEPTTEPAATTEAPSAEAPAVDEQASSDQIAIDRTRDAAKRLGGSLKQRLVAEMGEAGPVAAATVCSTDAVSMTSAVASESGVRVGRSSLRLRNPANGAPEWVAAWLAEQGERPAEGVTGLARVDEVDGRRYARVLAPLATEAPCLVCHGPKEGLASDVAGLLAERYPEDAAVGYQLGDLRGALWAESEIAAP